MVRSRYFTRHVNHFMRDAFTMIELIFAIVIIAVVTLTVPMMIQVNNKALEGNAAQEAIFLVSAVLSETTTLVWDNRSLVGGTTGYSLSKILDVPTGDNAYDRLDVNSTLRLGGLNEDLHRSFFDYNISNTSQTQPALLSGAVATLQHDITGSVAGIEGYKSSFVITASRQYVSDTVPAASAPFVFTAGSPQNQSNIKMTTVEINATVDGANMTLARLRAYTCNIGEIDFAKRRF